MSKQTPGELLTEFGATKEFWVDINPHLHITDEPFQGQNYDCDSQRLDIATRQLEEDGYFKIESIVPNSMCEALVLGIENVVNCGLPAPFALVYDEYWEVYSRLQNMLSHFVGADVGLVPDFWMWHIAKDANMAGWGPHRDDEIEGRPVLREDGKPLILTVWIPFSNATPLNSCMYLLPLSRDPSYPDKIEKNSLPEGALQHVRALPATPGTILGWNQYVLHWGGSNSKWANESRVSMAFYVQDISEMPFDLTVFDFERKVVLEDRLGVIGRMIWKYRKYGFDESVLSEII